MLARATLESLLKDRKLDRTIAVFPPLRVLVPPIDLVVPTGHARVDQCLEGGWPRGHLSELCGPAGAGRTTLMVGTLERVTREGELAALVDAADRFDPVPAAARGVVLERLLWVRGVVADRSLWIDVSRGSGAGRRGPASDRARRGAGVPAGEIIRSLTQALRAFDLILRAGGFAVAVLDLSGVPARVIKRLPFTTWLRLGRSVEGSRTAALVMVDEPTAPSAGGVSLELQPAPARWRGSSDLSRVFEGPSLAPRVRGFKRVIS
ncbi:MAG: hypothetical protein WD690_16330 [Vicinamibacterales bacterium]